METQACLHPFGRLGEHERGEVVELRVVRVQRLERRRRRRERRVNLRSISLCVPPRRSGVAHGRGNFLACYLGKYHLNFAASLPSTIHHECSFLICNSFESEKITQLSMSYIS